MAFFYSNLRYSVTSPPPVSLELESRILPPWAAANPVSYTHLDVYKRQILRPIRLPPESLPLLTRSRQFVGNSTPVIDSNHKIIKNQYPGETVTSSHSSFVLASFLLFSMTSTPNFERRTQMQAPKRRRNHPPALAGGATTSQFSLIHYRNPHNIADAGLLSLYVRGRDSCRQHDNIPGLRDLLGTYQFDGSIADILRCACLLYTSSCV